MTAARAALHASMLAAISSGCAPTDAALAVRIGDELTLRAPAAVLTVWIDQGAGAITAEIAGDPVVQLALAPGPLGWTTPSGQLLGGSAALQLAAIVDGAPAWTGSLDSAAYQLWRPDDRAALAGALDAAGLAEPLRAVLPYHRHARAWMAESAAVFAVAALADPATTLEPSSWPQVTTADQVDPPGKLAGDSPGLGMTCSTNIRCPPDAPICVTATHEQRYGFCSRACLDDGDCDRGLGLCGLAITDIPDVPDGMTGCYLTCAGDGSCPGLLQCAAEFDGDAGVCAPP